MDGGKGDSFQVARLQKILREELPLAAFMDVRVRRRDGSGLVLWAPEEPNRNAHGSLFGGSIGALALLAGWGFVHLGLQEERLEADVVVQRAETDYRAPMAGPVLAVALPPEPGAWNRFVRTLRRRGRARIRVTIHLREEGHAGPDAVMEAWFVALAEE